MDLTWIWDRFGRGYCETFDLGCRMPDGVIEDAVGGGQLICLDVSDREGGPKRTVERVLGRVEETLGRGTDKVMRVCVPSLGGAEWGEMTEEVGTDVRESGCAVCANGWCLQDLLGFLHGIRRLLGRHRHGCASVSLPSYRSTGWTQKLGWFCDGLITLNGTGGEWGWTGTRLYR